VKTAQNSQRIKASNTVLVTSHAVRGGGVKSCSGLEECSLVTATAASFLHREPGNDTGFRNLGLKGTALHQGCLVSEAQCSYTSFRVLPSFLYTRWRLGIMILLLFIKWCLLMHRT
jgi:hypothetical protein